MKYFSISFLLFLLFACGTTDKLDQSQTSTNEAPTDKPQRNEMLKSRIGEFIKSDPLTIEDVRLEDNTLFMTVTYPGGCARHQFQVIGSPALMKSLPPQRTVQVAHNANNDPCESLVTRILEIDLKNIAYEATPGSEIVLHFKGWKKGINYIYK